MDWHIFKCVQNKDSSGRFMIDCKLKNFTLELSIIQNNVAWIAEIQQDFIEMSAQKLKMDSLDYLKRLKEHFNSDNVEFKFAKNEFVLQYSLPNNFKVKYLQCKLSKVQSMFECVTHLLQTMYEEKNNAKKEMYTLKEETDCLRKSTADLEFKLIEIMTKKKKDEDILYSNFVLVLNEKKARIQHLTELLEAFRLGRPTVNPAPVLKKKEKVIKTPKVEMKNEVSESESEKSEADYNTDDEHIKTDKNLKDNQFNAKDHGHFSNILEENIPSTSKNYSVSSLLNNSPPTCFLPKRTKFNQKDKNSISLTNNNAEPSKDNVIKKGSDTEEESPCDGYNTQDLLDRI